MFLEVFFNISKSVDYYLITWDIPGVDITELAKSFKGQSLQSLIKIAPTDHYNNSTGPSYLASHLVNFIAPIEYDAVVDSRPDIVHFFQKDFSLDIDNNTVYPTWKKLKFNKMEIDDTIQFMSKKVYNIYCNRYKTESSGNMHADLYDHYARYNVKIDALDNKENWKRWIITRPNQLEYFAKECVTDDLDTLWQLWHDWDRILWEEKLLFFKKYNILEEDYKIANLNPIRY